MTQVESPWRSTPTRHFGPTGLEVLPLGLGTHGHGHAFGGVEKASSAEIFKGVSSATASAGSVLLDTAPRYGRGLVERWVGEALRSGAFPRAVVATKGGRHIEVERDNEKDFSRGHLLRGLDDSLGRLGLSNVFLFQLHNPSAAELRAGAVFDVLEEIRSRGMASWYGVSVDTVEEASIVLDFKESHEFEGLVSLQVIYSALTKFGWKPVFDRARDLGVAVIAREVLVRGLLTPRSLPYGRIETAPAVRKIVANFGQGQLEARRREVSDLARSFGLGLTELALSYAMFEPGVSVALVGTNRPGDLVEDWSEHAPLPVEAVAAIEALRDLVVSSGPTC